VPAERVAFRQRTHSFSAVCRSKTANTGGSVWVVGIEFNYATLLPCSFSRPGTVGSRRILLQVP
jgi:hypothetical protein